MKWVKQVVLVCGMLMVCLVGFSAETHLNGVALTYPDAAIMLAKHSGLFDRYVARSADLDECVAFLNEIGIGFGLLELMTEAEFKEKDSARVLAQAELIFSGNAEFVAGKVKLPADVVSWEEYCLLNDIKYSQSYNAMKGLLYRTGQKKR